MARMLPRKVPSPLLRLVVGWTEPCTGSGAMGCRLHPGTHEKEQLLMAASDTDRARCGGHIRDNEEHEGREESYGPRDHVGFIVQAVPRPFPFSAGSFPPRVAAQVFLHMPQT